MEYVNTKITKTVVSVMAITLAILHIANIIYLLPSHIILGLHLTFILFLIFLGKGLPKNKLFAAFDLTMLLVGVIACLNFSFNYIELYTNAYRIATNDIIMGILLVIVIIYATARTVGSGMAIIASTFVAYLFLGQYIPGSLGHPAFSLARIISHIYITSNGIFGSMLQISATYLAVYTIFGSFLEYCNASNAFINIAFKVTGKIQGGPALAAVIASMLFGMVNGSAVVNVVTTGTFTIPMMKSLGIAPYVAGAVEAAASTGGQLMPPVMGAGAFIMADITGIKYSEVIVRAAIPAIIYFIGVLSAVYFYVHKHNVPFMDPSLIPATKKIIKDSYLLIPFLLVLVLILSGYSPLYSAIIAVATAFILIVIQNYKNGKQILIKTGLSLRDGSLSLSSVACGLACAGLIVGCVTLSGLGSKFVSLVLIIAGANKLLALALIAFACLVLGMGLPTSAAYVLTATMAAPAMIEMGFPLFASHLFIFYFAVIAPVTPPVAIAAYAGAGIAEADPTRTGIQSFMFALPAFLCPFMFIYNTLLLANGPVLEVVWAGITAVLGSIAIGASTQRYLMGKLNPITCIVLLLAAFLLIKPGLVTDISGMVIIIAIIAYNKIQNERRGGRDNDRQMQHE